MNRIQLLLLGVIVFLPAISNAADKASERTQIGSDIRVRKDEKTADLTCIHCSVYVQGSVAGDITTVAGNIVLEPGAAVAGDITAVAGSLRLEDGSQVAGDVTVFAGTLHREQHATIAGEVTSLEGKGWLMLVILVPLLFLGGLAALVVWLLYKLFRPVPAPVHVPRPN
jgi:cytoskeletal protein CcmA (bactofilin family)